MSAIEMQLSELANRERIKCTKFGVKHISDNGV